MPVNHNWYKSLSLLIEQFPNIIEFQIHILFVLFNQPLFVYLFSPYAPLLLIHCLYLLLYLLSLGQPLQLFLQTLNKPTLTFFIRYLCFLDFFLFTFFSPFMPFTIFSKMICFYSWPICFRFIFTIFDMLLVALASNDLRLFPALCFWSCL